MANILLIESWQYLDYSLSLFWTHSHVGV